MTLTPFELTRFLDEGGEPTALYRAATRRIALGFYEDPGDAKLQRWNAEHEQQMRAVIRGFTDEDTTLAGLPSAQGPHPVATIFGFPNTVEVGAGAVPAWMITGVGVAPTHRRRGILRRMMEPELAQARSEGCGMAALTVSEGEIYGRFGFGLSTRMITYELDLTARPRLLPGVVGNAESLVEESHEGGLLEYPIYTKPAVWDGGDGVERTVPDVLLGGNHAAIAQWRHEQRLARTAARRPDLLHASSALTPGGVDDRWGGALIAKATPADVGDLLTCTHACWLREGILNDTLTIPAQHETVESLTASLHEWDTYVLRHDGRFIGSVRGKLVDDTWHIGRLMVVPDLHGRGLGRALLEFIQEVAPSDATRFELFTGTGSEHNLKLYKKAGFRGVVQPNGTTVVFTKRRRGR